MTLSANTARCDGGKCPSKTNCLRYTERTNPGDYKAQRDALLELLEQAGKALESMVQYSQESHEEPPFPASALDYEAYQLSCEIVSAIASVKGGA